MRRTFLVAAAAILLSSTGLAAKPAQNVSPKRHPNLASAQHLAAQAYEKLVAAQQANEFDMKGHAKRAKELLEQANAEIKAAAEAANEHAK